MRAGLLALLAGLAAPAAALAEPTEPGERPCFYSKDDARRIDFLEAYRQAHAASQAAFCFSGDPVIAALDRELEQITGRAQARNPDINLSTLEGRTGLEVCRIPASDLQDSCEKTEGVAVANFARAMAALREMTKKWR